MSNVHFFFFYMSMLNMISSFSIFLHLFRRADGAVPKAHTRLCSCHFTDGTHKIGRVFKTPTIFARTEKKAMQFESPEKTKRYHILSNLYNKTTK